MSYQRTQTARATLFAFAVVIVIQLIIASLLLTVVEDNLRLPLLVIAGFIIANDLLFMYLLSTITIEVNEQGIWRRYRHGIGSGFIPFSAIRPNTLQIVKSPFGRMVHFERTLPPGTRRRSRYVNLPSDEPEVLHEVLLNMLPH